MSAGRLLAALLQAFSLVLIARSVSPSEFGLLSVVLALATVAQTAIDMGVATFISRERASNPDSGAITVALRFNNLSSIALAIIAAAALLLAAAFISPSYLLMLPLALWMSGERNADARLTVAFADGDAKINVFNLLARRLGSILLFLIFLSASVEPLLGYSIAVASAALASSVFANSYVRKRVTAPPDISYRTLLREAWPYWLHSVSTQARNLDVVVTTAFAGALQAGFYSAASRLTSPLRLLPSSLATVLLPASSRAVAHSKSLRPMVRTVLLVTLGMTFVYAVLIPLMPWVVNLALGQDYEPAVPVMQIVVAGLPFAASASLVASLLQGIGRKHLVATTSTITTVVCLVGVGLSSALAGAVGAGVALSASFILQCAILWAALGSTLYARRKH